MHSGLYGYFALDGAPIVQHDRSYFVQDTEGVALQESPNCLVQAADLAYPTAIQMQQAHSDFMAFVGYFDEAEALATKLGLSNESPAPVLARAAVERWGDDAPTHMIGEWSFAWWQGESRALTLLTSLHTRDSIFYAIRGGQLAIAPDVRWLRRFNWVDSTLDVEPILCRMGCDAIRRMNNDHSMIRGARKLLPGARAVFTKDREHIGKPAALPEIEDWQGSFEDAMAETDTAMRRMFRQKIAREGTVAITLSGGLDSSLIAMYAAQERRAGQDIIILTSASPLGSDIQDETEYARIVADHLGLPIEFIRPPTHANLYRPAEHYFEAPRAPFVSPRHYVHNAFLDAAAQHGATAIYDGVMGEATVSYPLPLQQPRPTIKSRLRAMRDAWRTRAVDEPWPYGGFYIAISSNLAAQVPKAFEAAWAEGLPEIPPIDASKQWGYMNWARRVGEGGTQGLPGSIRLELPFRDVRLLQSFARYPAGFTGHDGVDRAPARALMRGHLPDSIRLRPKGGAFSPDYYERLQTGAMDAANRIPVFQAAGVDQWLDLDWLEVGLKNIHTRGTSDVSYAFKVQLTAMMAEYLSWWQNTEPS